MSRRDPPRMLNPSLPDMPESGPPRSTAPPPATDKLPEIEPPQVLDFDFMLDVLLPCLLWAMLAALVWFLIDVRAALVQGPTKLLRFVFFFFMVAVVGIARIRARDGAFNAAPYAIGLLIAMGLFGFRFSFGGGLFGGGYGGGDPMQALLLTYLIIGFIWWASNYVVDRTTLDPLNIEVQQAGFLTSEEWAAHGDRAAAARRRPHPGRAVMVMSIIAVVLFGLGHKLLANQEGYQRHAFWCMVVFLACALGVLSMSALCGLEIYVRQRGAGLSPSVVSVWVLLTVPVAAAILLLAHVAPRLEPQPNSLLPQAPAIVQRLMTRFKDSPIEGMSQAEHPEGTHDSEGDRGEDDSAGPTARGEGGKQEGGDQPGGEKGGQDQGEGEGAAPGGESGKGQGGQGGEGGGEEQTSEEGERRPDQPGAGQPSSEAEGGKSGEEQREGEGQGRQQEEGRQAAAQASPTATPGQAPPVAGLGDLLAKLISLLAALAGAALLCWVLYRAIAPLRGKAGGWLGALLARLRGAGGEGPPVAVRDPFVDPFAPRSPFRGRPPAELVIHVYRAFQAYAAMAGFPRRPDRTAHEFLADLAPSTAPWRAQIELLTDLYAAAEYTPERVDASCLEDLRAIWERLMQAVREVRG